MKAISGVIIMSLSLALLWHFSNIWRYGQYLIKEPNIIALVIETVGLVVILVFGIYMFIGEVIRRRNEVV